MYQRTMLWTNESKLLYMNETCNLNTGNTSSNVSFSALLNVNLFHTRWGHSYINVNFIALIYGLMKQWKQDCIPVGCILPARWPYFAACSAPGGVLSLGGVLSPWGLCALGGVSASGGCLLPGGWVCSGGVCSHLSPGVDTPLLTEWQTPVKI